MRIRVVLELRDGFDGEVGQLVSDLSEAAAEGQHELDELLAVLPARLRRLIRHQVTLRPAARAPIAPGGGSEAPSVMALSSMADGSPATPRAGRPLGLSTRRRQLLAGETAVPLFTVFRTQQQLSLAAIAERATASGREISRATLGNLESGETLPRLHHAEAIAAALGLELGAALNLLEIESGHVVEV